MKHLGMIIRLQTGENLSGQRPCTLVLSLHGLGLRRCFGVSLSTLRVVRRSQLVCQSHISQLTLKVVPILGQSLNQLTTMSRDDIVAAGGFWVYLRANQGVIIPPASLIMNMNRGAMNIPDSAEDDELAQAACDYMVPSQIDISVN